MGRKKKKKGTAYNPRDGGGEKEEKSWNNFTVTQIIRFTLKVGGNKRKKKKGFHRGLDRRKGDKKGE